MAPTTTPGFDVLTLLNRDHGLWLVTGGAGFIGSNIVETLLKGNQRVRVLDNFATGYEANLQPLAAAFNHGSNRRLEIVHGDIRSFETCKTAALGVAHVLHQAALGSVPRSIKDPVTTNDVNVGGFVNVLEASRLAGVKSFTYAASSSTYGDEPNLPKIEDRIGNPLSPYAVTKYVNELYAKNFALAYGFRSIGLRYFNVFGPRQDPEGAYAAVIPKWIAAMLKNETVQINGDGETSRDFCFVANAVQANILAALAGDAAKNQVYNVAFGERTTLNQLFELLRVNLREFQIHYDKPSDHGPERAGDVRHSLADISKAQKILGYAPAYDVRNGLVQAMPWYVARFSGKGKT